MPVASVASQVFVLRQRADRRISRSSRLVQFGDSSGALRVAMTLLADFSLDLTDDEGDREAVFTVEWSSIPKAVQPAILLFLGSDSELSVLQVRQCPRTTGAAA